MNNTYIIDGIRTPIGSLKGSLAGIRTDDLAAMVIKELMQRNQHIDPNLIGDVIIGCANQAGEDNRKCGTYGRFISRTTLYCAR